jgi:hypothetical protein
MFDFAVLECLRHAPFVLRAGVNHMPAGLRHFRRRSSSRSAIHYWSGIRHRI